MGRLISNETKTSLIALALIAITALANIGPYIIGVFVLVGLISSYYGPGPWFQGGATFGVIGGVFMGAAGVAYSLGYTTLAWTLLGIGLVSQLSVQGLLNYVIMLVYKFKNINGFLFCSLLEGVIKVL
jgi:hypothetical protein